MTNQLTVKQRIKAAERGSWGESPTADTPRPRCECPDDDGREPTVLTSLVRLTRALGLQSTASVSDLFGRMRGVPTDEIRAAADAILAGEDGAYERVQALLDGRPFEPPASRSCGPSAFAIRARKVSRQRGPRR